MPKYGTALRNARLAADETTIGTSPKLRVYSGTVPANADASIGAATLLAEAPLPSDWQGAPSAGAAAKAGTWTFDAAVGTGTPTFCRLWDSAGTTCHMQFTAGVGSGEVQFNGTITTGQTGITVSAFSRTEGNG